ncbi:FAD-binding oxidoreductase, partial [Candidatus Saccharibacteria bacterium]|nr:FAD-binding oxidoreductase [Candidatus Saccharibacteria bacterium]
MSKIGHYLQEHIMGEVISATDARRHFATDASIFSMAPALIVYPQNENDVRKVARFSWQLAERNRIVPITARGSGTDQAGAAIGNGLMMVFPAHMNRIVELDAKTGHATVEPGINYGKLQQTLMTHGRFLPPYPASLEYSTVGGAVANNASGEKSVKYGDTRSFVRGLRVVLANGEVITTHRLSKREVNKKLGLATFEGEIYRSLDTLIEENQQVIAASELQVSKNSAGYDLLDVKRKDGSIDLTPLFVGSQGTLGVITEITLETESHEPQTTLLIAAMDSVQQLQTAVLELRKLSETPSAIELIDGNLITTVRASHPNLLKNVIDKPYPKFVLLVEFDGKESAQKKGAKAARKLFDKHASSYRQEHDLEKQSELWKIRHLSGVLAAHHEGGKKALPIIEDSVVPANKLGELLQATYDMFARYKLPVAVWGHAGDGNLHLQPYLDLSQIGDRQKAFKLMDDYYRMVISLGGSTSGQGNDGRLRAPYLKELYGNEMYAVFQKLKRIFDPYGTLNPGVKVDVTTEDIKPLVRNEFTV